MNNFQEQGRALYKRGDYRKAIGLFDRALGRAPSVQLLDNRAACYEKLGELSTALKDAKKAIQLHREDATGYLRAGKVLVKIDKNTVALEIYTHGLKCIKHVGQGYELLRMSHKGLMDKLCPPKSVDPLTVLPRELAELILDHLSFRQRINACLVSKGWAQFIRSSPNLWTHLDLSGARRKVRGSFISRAINIARTKLTGATLNNLWEFDKTVAALVKVCPLEELNLLRCGLQGHYLTTVCSKAKRLKRLKISSGTELQAFQLQHLLQAVSTQIELFHCTISHGGMATIDGATCQNLKTLDLSFSTTHGLTSLLANVSERLPALQSLTLNQLDTDPGSRTGMHMDLEKCSQLQHLDLSLVFTSTSLLALPPSLLVLRLHPMLVSRPADFFRPMILGIQREYFLPKLEELDFKLRGLAMDHLKRYLIDPLTQEEPVSGKPVVGTKLRRLAIREVGTGDLTELGDFLLHPRLVELQELSLAGARVCDDATVERVSEILPKLQTLDLSETDITGVGVKQALQPQHLKRLLVNNCRLIGRDAIDWARAQGVVVEHRMSDTTSGGRKVRF